MTWIESTVLLAVACLLAISFRSRFAHELAQAIEQAIDNFKGGGPPTPMHPSPAGDDRLLRRRPGKIGG